MDVYELVKEVGGEIVNGRARVRQGREYIQLGRITPEGMVMTQEGKDMADLLAKPKPAKKKAATKKAAAGLTAEAPAVTEENPEDGDD